jgi:hypothetical protein
MLSIAQARGEDEYLNEHTLGSIGSFPGIYRRPGCTSTSYPDLLKNGTDGSTANFDDISRITGVSESGCGIQEH